MPSTETSDPQKQLTALYKATSAVAIVDVPAMNFLMVDGVGDPNTSHDFSAAIETLYGVAYTLKFTAKRAAKPVDFKVMPLEGLWWADDMRAFASGNRETWHWTLMIAQPSFISAARVAAAIEAVGRKKPHLALNLVRFGAFEEGRAVQLLHIGPYDTETANIRRLHDFIAAHGATLSGKHHEIYLSDARRTAPDKLRTIIRQPFVAKAG
jgi:hypothetical protein